MTLSFDAIRSGLSKVHMAWITDTTDLKELGTNKGKGDLDGELCDDGNGRFRGSRGCAPGAAIAPSSLRLRGRGVEEALELSSRRSGDQVDGTFDHFSFSNATGTFVLAYECFQCVFL
jgi:hypothetical protein